MQILTHRGLDSAKNSYYTESSKEAFEDQLTRGFGLEFDLQFTSDSEIVIFHDDSLSRLTDGKRNEKFSALTWPQIENLEIAGCHFVSLKQLLELINRQNFPVLCAIHVKGKWQQREFLDLLLKKLVGIDEEIFFLFDLKPVAAEYLKAQNSSLHLAPSVAHPYDIVRFNQAVEGTLISPEQATGLRQIYDWIWLDEWDLKDTSGQKMLYKEEVFSLFRAQNFKIALVTPELHRTSPGLLEGEAHPDAADMEKLEARLKQILSLKPDVVCTDYPDMIRELSQKS